MRSRPLLVVVAGSTLALSLGTTRGDAPRTQAGWAEQLLPLDVPHPLPPLPETPLRSANYSIEARLDPDKHKIDGTMVLEWRNTSTVAVESIPFHLYWYASRSILAPNSICSLATSVFSKSRTCRFSIGRLSGNDNGAVLGEWNHIKRHRKVYLHSSDSYK